MKRTSCCTALLMLVLSVAFAPQVFAVAYYPLVHHQPADETARTTGQSVYLFHSGTADVRALLHPGDVLAVYRTNQECAAVQVGRVRLIALVGETYAAAEVVEGAVKANDLVQQGSVACLVLAAEPCQRP